MQRFIHVENITSGYHHQPVLHDISVRIAEKEFIGIIGPNGSGKSTLLRSLSSALLPFKGTIRYKGSDPINSRSQKLPKNLPLSRRRAHSHSLLTHGKSQPWEGSLT